MAADHQRLDVIDALLAASLRSTLKTRYSDDSRCGWPPNADARNQRLTCSPAEPTRTTATPPKGRTALYWCRRAAKNIQFPSGHQEVDTILTAALERA